jgi:proline racemase
MHTGGEPLRIFTGGLPKIKGATILEKRRYFRKHCAALLYDKHELQPGDPLEKGFIFR